VERVLQAPRGTRGGGLRAGLRAFAETELLEPRGLEICRPVVPTVLEADGRNDGREDAGYGRAGGRAPRRDTRVPGESEPAIMRILRVIDFSEFSETRSTRPCCTAARLTFDER
jgi:hypothetical protein